MSQYEDKKVDTTWTPFVGSSIFHAIKLVPTFMSFYNKISSLRFLVPSSKSLDFHVTLLRPESTYKIYDNGYLSTNIYEILV